MLGLSIMAVDGTTFRCQDSEDNAKAFGFISQKHKPYPQLRLVGLMATETRFMMGGCIRCLSGWRGNVSTQIISRRSSQLANIV
ncbi:hypothetical protein VIBHAR_01906 [Vibrio campbellii ATCC BAA-1116]|uniref:Transposase n=1 Tax=Vibrio campbellii (strain ATCC BAA-1116) TaxID=2902295 RepID=A7MYR0_VIBC1|nr:hypothetical protein VIBHAR_01906 [Vibrio campbellii ATCC BAA-1116]